MSLTARASRIQLPSGLGARWWSRLASKPEICRRWYQPSFTRLNLVPRNTGLQLQVPRFLHTESSDKDVETISLENGLRVVSYPMSSARNVATVGVWLNFGSRTEKEEEGGVVHFLEHMTFKGTKTRSREDIERFVEQRGAHLNAYTTKEQVAYFANCLSRDAPDLLSLILDLLKNSKLEVSAVESEKQVILREYKEVERVNEEILFDKIHEHIFGDSQLGRLILGTERQIALMTRPRLAKFMNEMYNAENMVVVIAGDHDLKKILSVCRSSGGGPPQYERVDDKRGSASQKETFRGGCEVFIDETPDTLQSRPLLFFGFTAPGVSWSDPEFYAYMLCRMLLSNGTISVENLPVAGSRIKVPTSLPSASAHGQPVFFDAYYKDGGLLGVYSSAEVPEDLIELWTEMGTTEALAMPDFKVLARELVGVQLEEFEERMRAVVGKISETWTVDEIESAKDNLTICFAQALESSSSAAEELGRQMLVHGRACPFSEVKDAIAAVTLENVRSVAERAFTSDASKVALTALLRLPSANENGLNSGV